MTRTTQIAIGSVAAVLLMSAAVVVKLIYFPAVREEYFQVNANRLHQVPAGLVVVRPTHSPVRRGSSSSPAMTQSVVNNTLWMVGRNFNLQQLMALAYRCEPGRVTLPPDAPKGNYDFLVTVPKDPQERLQAAIDSKLGYTAKRETRETAVLALKVQNPGLPGLTMSTAGRPNVSAKGGRLLCTHLNLAQVAQGLEQFLPLPVVDQTGLTNFFDFSVAWDMRTQQQVMNKSTARDALQKILNGWGLGLEPDTASLEVLVVKKAR